MRNTYNRLKSFGIGFVLAAFVAAAGNVKAQDIKAPTGKIYDHGVSWEKEFSVTQAYSINGTIYIAGQFSHNMKGEFVGEGDIKAQARQTFENLDRVLAGYGITKSNIAELEIYLMDTTHNFEPFVEVYKGYVGTHRPAVTLIGVSGLAFPQQLVEIRAVAHSN
ncbi:RidA family protein [Rhizobium sp. BR 362]|uniref:RidA family protein n=1 Tax=Rhizobium sp. BR 362 TaxID=3040670 RepID=UPI002F413AB2